MRKKKESKKAQRKVSKQFACKVNDMVRLSHLKKPFQRAYQQQWTFEIFKIHKRFLLHGKKLYKVNDFLDEEIKGHFYSSELQRVKKDENSVWYVEKILMC